MPSASSSTPSTQSTAAAAAPPTATRPPTSATSATTAARPAAMRGPKPAIAAERDRARRHVGLAGPADDPRGPARAVPPPPRPLQRLQRARGDRLLPVDGDRGGGHSRSASSRSPPASAAPSGSRSGREALSILLIKNPAGANEVFRTLNATTAARRRRRARPADRPERRHRRRPRHLVDLGRRLREPRAERCTGSSARARARPSSRCGSSTRACPPSASRWSAARARRSTVACRRRRQAALRAPHLHGAARAARPPRRPRPRAPLLGGRVKHLAVARRSGTTSSAAAIRADLPLWRELRRAAANRRTGCPASCSRSAAAPAV